MNIELCSPFNTFREIQRYLVSWSLFCVYQINYHSNKFLTQIHAEHIGRKCCLQY